MVVKLTFKNTVFIIYVKYLLLGAIIGLVGLSSLKIGKVYPKKSQQRLKFRTCVLKACNSGFSPIPKFGLLIALIDIPNNVHENFAKTIIVVFFWSFEIIFYLFIISKSYELITNK